MEQHESITVGVIIGSTRQGRFGEQPARWIFDRAAATEGLEPELLDLRDYPMPFFDEPVSPAMTKEPYDNEVVQKWGAKIDAMDAYIVATPEYNRGPSAVLKNALDYVYHQWNKKPVGFVSWGGVGGTRAVEHLRTTSIELQMVPVRNGVHIERPWAFMDENGTMKPEGIKPYERGGRMRCSLIFSGGGNCSKRRESSNDM